MQLVTALAVGAVAGWALGFLMRDGRRASPWLVVAGAAGAAGAALAAAAGGPVDARGIALAATTALAGGLFVSFATRLSMFAREREA